AGAEEVDAETDWFEDAESAAEWMPEELRSGDVLLVKGSRGVGLDRVVKTLLAAAGGGPA
ncbi:MAG TPA: UDP-N-acetylmuramoylalanyl-D-glutamyl-2, 6-diaminopimelate--D-alanyl-D-alanine ligase, partial [Thermoanaerobaculia bacterium]